jgi:hypothetical protein
VPFCRPPQLPLVRPPHSLGPLAPLAVGRIYQRFSSLAEGRAENIIEATARLPPLEGAGIEFVVEAGYQQRTSRSIALLFEGARAGGVRLSPQLQNFVASPLLPRGWWQLQALQWLQQVRRGRPGGPLGEGCPKASKEGSPNCVIMRNDCVPASAIRGRRTLSPGQTPRQPGTAVHL